MLARIRAIREIRGSFFLCAATIRANSCHSWQ